MDPHTNQADEREVDEEESFEYGSDRFRARVPITRASVPFNRVSKSHKPLSIAIPQECRTTMRKTNHHRQSLKRPVIQETQSWHLQQHRTA